MSNYSMLTIASHTLIQLNVCTAAEGTSREETEAATRRVLQRLEDPDFVNSANLGVQILRISGQDTTPDDSGANAPCPSWRLLLSGAAGLALLMVLQGEWEGLGGPEIGRGARMKGQLCAVSCSSRLRARTLTRLVTVWDTLNTLCCWQLACRHWRQSLLALPRLATSNCLACLGEC